MAGNRSRNSGLFSGLVLISAGVILLLHNYGRLDLSDFFTRWWPLLIIFWGLVKLYERSAGRRFGGGAGGISGGEVALVIGMLVLMGAVVIADVTKEKFGVAINDIHGDNFEYDLDVAPKTIPANAPVVVRTTRGDIVVRASDDALLEISAKKNVRAWDDREAQRAAKPVTVEITQSGGAYEVHPSGYDTGDSRIDVDLDVSVPKKSPLTVRTDKGDVTVSDFLRDVSITDQNGDVEVRGTTGGVSIEMKKGDVKVSDTTGDVKISGKGGEVEVTDASGSLTVDGDFYGPVRAERVARGVRLVSPRTDLTVSALAGHLEASSGNLDLVDAPGLVTLRTRDMDVNIENAGGKVQIENRNAPTTVRFTSAPKEDISITNSSSGVTLSLPGSSSFEVVADCRNCDIESEFAGLDATKSESGDSHLAGKSGSAKGPKITLRTSYGNIQLMRTSLTVPAPPRVPGSPHPPTAPSEPKEIPPESEQ